MGVLHFFLVNSTLIFILFSLTIRQNETVQKMNHPFLVKFMWYFWYKETNKSYLLKEFEIRFTDKCLSRFILSRQCIQYPHIRLQLNLGLINQSINQSQFQFQKALNGRTGTNYIPPPRIFKEGKFP